MIINGVGRRTERRESNRKTERERGVIEIKTERQRETGTKRDRKRDEVGMGERISLYGDISLWIYYHSENGIENLFANM